MSIQPISGSTQEIIQLCKSTDEQRRTLLTKVNEAIKDLELFKREALGPEGVNTQGIQALMRKYQVTSVSELSNIIQRNCSEKIQSIRASNPAIDDLIRRGKELLSRSRETPLGAEDQPAKELEAQLDWVQWNELQLAEKEQFLVQQLRQEQQAPAPMEGVVEAPLPPRIEFLVQNIDEKWKKPVSSLLLHLSDFALARIGNLQDVDIKKLLASGADFINEHQKELAYIPIEKLIDLEPKVLEKLPHSVLRAVAPRAIFSINPLVLNDLPDELLALLDGNNLEQFALLDDADLKYFKTMTRGQRETLRMHANLIKRLPLSKLMRLTSNKEALVALDKIQASTTVPHEFWENVHPDIWNKFSKNVCMALTPQFFDALYNIRQNPHQYRGVVTNSVLTKMLEYLKSGVITSDSLKSKIDQMPFEETRGACDTTKMAEDAERRKWATYSESYFTWLRASAFVFGLASAIVPWIYSSSRAKLMTSAVVEAASKMMGAEALGMAANMVGHAAVMAECGPAIVLVGGVGVTALNAVAITHQIREWGRSEWATAAFVATGTGLLVFFLSPAAIPVIGSYLATGEWVASATIAVKTAFVTGAVNFLTIPLAKMGRSIGSLLIHPGDREEGQKEQAMGTDPRIQASVERAAFLKTLTHLNAVSENLTEMARTGMLRPAIGREEELGEIIRTLTGGGERASVMLLGETGCGKTSIANGLAYKVARGEVPPELQNIEVLQISLLRIQTDTEYRGTIEAKLGAIMDEVNANYNRIVLFVDEAHLLASVGAAQDTRAIYEYLKDHLTNPVHPLRLIGATTPSEYNQAFREGDPFRRRFMEIQVQRPDIPKTVEMIQGYYRRHLENHDLVQIDDDAIVEAATLAQERLPDSAIKLLERICIAAYASNRGETIVRITKENVLAAAPQPQIPAIFPAPPEDEEEGERPAASARSKRPRAQPQLLEVGAGERAEEAAALESSTKYRRAPSPEEGTPPHNPRNRQEGRPAATGKGLGQDTKQKRR